jgi:hypothetical protein
MAEVLDFIDRKDPNAPWYKNSPKYATVPLWPEVPPALTPRSTNPRRRSPFFPRTGRRGQGCVVVMGRRRLHLLNRLVKYRCCQKSSISRVNQRRGA